MTDTANEMFEDVPARGIAARLSPAQRQLLPDLVDWTILGCVETVAIRLSKPSGTRPALVERRRGDQCHEFRLNAAGRGVVAALDISHD